MKWITRLMAFTGAAVVVVAQSFVLVDPSGVIVAAFDAAGGPGAVPALVFHHNDPANIADSTIFWTDSPSATTVLEIRGPDATATVEQFPRVALTNTAAGLSSLELAARSIHIATGTIPTDGEILVSSNNPIRVDDLTAVGAGGPLPRGNIYGVSGHTGLLGANTNLVVANTVLITVNIPEALIAGAFIEVTWTTDINCLIAANHVALTRIGINGALQLPFGVLTTNQLGHRATVSNTFQYVIPVTGAAVAITLNATASLNNAYNALTSGTVLSITYYR